MRGASGSSVHAAAKRKKSVHSATPVNADAAYEWLRVEGARWLADPNIVGVSIGEKETGGAPTGIVAVKFDVTTKLSAAPEILRAGSRPIPTAIEVRGQELPTDVVEAWPESDGLAPINRNARLNPVLGGISVGSSTDTGTLGAIAWHRPTGQAVALSNFHVLANDPEGTSVYQPGPLDGAAQHSPLGRVTDKALDIDLDAAAATIEGRRVSGAIAGLGVELTGTVEPRPGMRVVKSGKETDVTYGRISPTEPFKRTSYHVFGRPVWHQIMVCVIQPDPNRPSAGPLSVKGDSGACWMEAADDGRLTGNMVALHVGGDPRLRLAYGCRADKLFERFGLEALGNRGSGRVESFVPGTGGLGSRYRVIARRGLIVRAGPGVEFAAKGQLSFGNTVNVISRQRDWLLVDLKGDGKADGFMHAAFMMQD